MKIDLTPQDVRDLFSSHGYPLPENQITVFGKRNAVWSDVDKFNDVLGIYWDGQVLSYSGTTKPGKHWLISDDGNKDGVFILRPDYYENCWHKGMHNGKYKALKQFGSGIFKGWRDNDLDGKFDINGKLWDNVTGLNLHTTRWDRQVKGVGQFSAGCQVVEVAKEYDQIMIEVIYESLQSLFSYALFQD